MRGEENKWKLMLDEVKPDVVFISTNWDNHAPMAIESMKKGAHVFVEVPIATNLEDMWKIINTSEKEQKHCMMLENVNYFRAEIGRALPLLATKYPTNALLPDCFTSSQEGAIFPSISTSKSHFPKICLFSWEFKLKNIRRNNKQ